jgi:hypothetical protein
VQLLSKSWFKSLLRYLALFLAVWIGFLIYTTDRNPPELVSLEFSTDTLDPAAGISTFQFKGEVSDERLVSKAQFVCVRDGIEELVIIAVTSGSNRYKVGFGKTSSSPDWLGSWDGNGREIRFAGYGRLPKGVDPLECEWVAQLEDNLGNSTEFPTGHTLRVVSTS